MLRYITRNVRETEALAVRFAEKLRPGDVLAFYGGLGMGKTAFIRGLARGLNITDAVSSPTFALVHEYRGKTPLYHFDMYRVSGWDDLSSTGFYDYLESGGICAVEWSENIEQALDGNVIRIHIEADPTDENTRIITIEGMEPDGNQNTGL